MIHRTSSLVVSRKWVNSSVDKADAAGDIADTVVIKGEEIMEKPLDALDNFRMLAELNDGEVRLS